MELGTRRVSRDFKKKKKPYILLHDLNFLQ